MSAADEDGRELGGDEALAAEYVLGVLPADQREAAVRRMDAEPAFARLVEEWEARLADLGEGYAAVEPPASVKQALDRRLFATEAEAAGLLHGMWRSIAVWRGIAAVAVLALVAVLLQPLVLAPDRAAGRLVASLAPNQSDVHYFVVYDGRTNDIGLSHVTGNRPAGRDFELWVIEGGRPPASVGVIPAGSTAHLAVTEEIERRIDAGSRLAISLEPPGGSPTGQPTGPVVAAGELHGI